MTGHSLGMNLNELKQAVTIAQARVDVLVAECAHNPSDANLDDLNTADEALNDARLAYDLAVASEDARLYETRKLALASYLEALHHDVDEPSEASRVALSNACDAYTTAVEACRTHRKDPSR